MEMWFLRQPDPFVIQERPEVGELEKHPPVVGFKQFGTSLAKEIYVFWKLLDLRFVANGVEDLFSAWTFVIKGPEFLGPKNL